MHITGIPHLTARRQVILPRMPNAAGEPQAAVLTISALPLGWKRRLEAVYPVPVAPVDTVNKGGELTYVPRYHEPAFQAAWRERKDLESYYMLWLALKDAPEIAPAPPIAINSQTELAAFRMACEQSGLSEGDFALLFDAIQQVSNLDAKEVEARRAGFSSRTMRPTTAP